MLRGGEHPGGMQHPEPGSESLPGHQAPAAGDPLGSTAGLRAWGGSWGINNPVLTAHAGSKDARPSCQY